MRSDYLDRLVTQNEWLEELDRKAWNEEQDEEDTNSEDEDITEEQES